METQLRHSPGWRYIRCDFRDAIVSWHHEESDLQCQFRVPVLCIDCLCANSQCMGLRLVVHSIHECMQDSQAQSPLQIQNNAKHEHDFRQRFEGCLTAVLLQSCALTTLPIHRQVHGGFLSAQKQRQPEHSLPSYTSIHTFFVPTKHYIFD